MELHTDRRSLSWFGTILFTDGFPHFPIPLTMRGSCPDLPPGIVIAHVWSRYEIERDSSRSYEEAYGEEAARGGQYVDGKAKETDDEYPHDRQGRGDVFGRHGTDGLPAGEGPQAAGLQGGRAMALQSRHDRVVDAEGRRPRVPGRVILGAGIGIFPLRMESELTQRVLGRQRQLDKRLDVHGLGKHVKPL